MKFISLIILLSFMSQMVSAGPSKNILKHRFMCFTQKGNRILVDVNVQYSLKPNSPAFVSLQPDGKDWTQYPYDCELSGQQVFCPESGVEFTLNSSLREMRGSLRSLGFFKKAITCTDWTVNPPSDTDM